MKILNSFFKQGPFLIVCIATVFLVLLSCEAQNSRKNEWKSWPTEYFGDETIEAVQAISYGFTPWYESEDSLPGGVIKVSPTGDASGVQDRANIQKAVDSMSNAGGGKVLLEAGKYYVINQVAMKSNVILQGALIKNEDWTGSVITQPQASRIRDGFPSRPEDVVVVENLINMKGSSFSWLAEGQAKSYPRVFADINEPDQMNSVYTDANLAGNMLINNTLVRAHGMVVRIGNSGYQWNEPAKRWENLDGGEPVYYINDPVGIEVMNPDEFILYQNPVSNGLRINLPLALEESFSIIDIQGMVRITGTIQNDQIQVDDLERGFYMMEFAGRQLRFIK